MCIDELQFFAGLKSELDEIEKNTWAFVDLDQKSVFGLSCNSNSCLINHFSTSLVIHQVKKQRKKANKI